MSLDEESIKNQIADLYRKHEAVNEKVIEMKIHQENLKDSHATHGADIEKHNHFLIKLGAIVGVIVIAGAGAWAFLRDSVILVKAVSGE